jgi:hypothetical protein
MESFSIECCLRNKYQIFQLSFSSTFLILTVFSIFFKCYDFIILVAVLENCKFCLAYQAFFKASSCHGMSCNLLTVTRFLDGTNEPGKILWLSIKNKNDK